MMNLWTIKQSKIKCESYHFHELYRFRFYPYSHWFFHISYLIWRVANTFKNNHTSNSTKKEDFENRTSQFQKLITNPFEKLITWVFHKTIRFVLPRNETTKSIVFTLGVCSNKQKPLCNLEKKKGQKSQPGFGFYTYEQTKQP